MLRAHGHEVTQYCVHNDSIAAMNRLQVASRTIWSQSAFRELRRLFRTHRPQIAHFHNTFPLISPAAYYAARAENVRVVQTLHNLRLLCANALLFRNGEPCEDCLGKAIPWPGVVHKCYRGTSAVKRTSTSDFIAVSGFHWALTCQTITTRCGGSLRMIVATMVSVPSCDISSQRPPRRGSIRTF